MMGGEQEGLGGGLGQQLVGVPIGRKVEGAIFVSKLQDSRRKRNYDPTGRRKKRNKSNYVKKGGSEERMKLNYTEKRTHGRSRGR